MRPSSSPPGGRRAADTGDLTLAADANGEWTPRGCEVPGCPNQAGYGLKRCDEHLRPVPLQTNRLQFWPLLEEGQYASLADPTACYCRRIAMTRNRTAILAPLLILTACSEGAPTAPGSRALVNRPAEAAVAASPARPFGGRCDTKITFLPPLPGDPPNLLRLHIDYDCQLKHLGRTTASAEQIVIFTSPTTTTASNTTTYTAANGDQLFAHWTGTSTSSGPDITFSQRGRTDSRRPTLCSTARRDAVGREAGTEAQGKRG